MAINADDPPNGGKGGTPDPDRILRDELLKRLAQRFEENPDSANSYRQDLIDKLQRLDAGASNAPPKAAPGAAVPAADGGRKPDKIRDTFLIHFVLLRKLQKEEPHPLSNKALFDTLCGAALAIRTGNRPSPSFTTRLNRMKEKGFIQWEKNTRAQLISITHIGKTHMDFLKKTYLEPAEFAYLQQHAPWTLEP